MNALIRPATATDKKHIFALYARTNRPARTAIHLDEYLVASIDGKVVACIASHACDAGIYLFGLTVEKEHRHKGIGSALVKACETRVCATARKLSFALVMFWNIPFLRTLGFRLVRRNQVPQAVLELSDFKAPTYRRSSVMVHEL